MVRILSGRTTRILPALWQHDVFKSERWPGELHIAVGCLDGELDRQPDTNAFFDAHVGWMPIDLSLKQLDG